MAKTEKKSNAAEAGEAYFADTGEGISNHIALAEQDADHLAELQAAVKVPAGDVLVRRVRGVDGLHPIGHVSLGRLYTMNMTAAIAYCVGDAAEFEPVLKADRAAIDTASKEHQLTTSLIGDKERELAALKSAK